jgi:hypothetical protein
MRYGTRDRERTVVPTSSCKFLEKRLAQHAHYTNWTAESLRDEVGDEASRQELRGEDFDYLVESLAAHLDAGCRR